MLDFVVNFSLVDVLYYKCLQNEYNNLILKIFYQLGTSCYTYNYKFNPDEPISFPCEIIKPSVHATNTTIIRGNSYS